MILHVLECACILKFIKRVGEKDKMRSIFPDEFNKFNNTGARMQDSIYHMTLKSHLLANFALKSRDYGFRKCDVFIDV